MTQHGIAALCRPWASPSGRRALLLVGLGAGIWLAGSAGSSAAADEVSPQPPAPVTASGFGDRAGSLLSPVTTAVEPVVAPVVEAAVAPVTAAVAPVTAAVAPVVDVVAPVRERVLAPVVRAVEPVTAPVAAVLRPVLEPVVAPVVPVLSPVAAPVAPALPPVVRDAVDPVPAPSGVRLGDSTVLPAPAPASQVVENAGPVPSAAEEGAAVRTTLVDRRDGALTPVPAPVPGGKHLPMPRTAVPSGAPAVASGPSSPDQPVADLPPAATPAVLTALNAAADGARDAAADRAFDPTFSPD